MDIYVLGIGNNTPVIIEIAERCGFEVRLMDYANRMTEYMGYKVLPIGFYPFALYALSMGDNQARREMASNIIRKRGILPTLIDPAAYVSPHAELKPGVIIHPGAVVQAGTKIGVCSVVGANTTITHTSIIGDFCYIALGSTVGAYVNIAEGVLVGVGATIVSGKVNKIGINAIIGGGSVVIDDVPDNAIMVGNPAKIKRC
jgi:sugar O-acyltransferase (sialic acid O-acetyltransferase NeuD family)